MQTWRGFRWLVFLLAVSLLIMGLIKTNLGHSLEDGWRETTTGIRTVARVDGYVTNVEFTADGQGVFIVTQHDGTQLRRVADGTLLHTFGAGFGRATLSADETLLATTMSESAVQLWHLSDDPTVLHTLPTGPVYNLAFAPNGQQLAVTTGREVQVWAVPDGSPVHTLPLDGASLAYTADSQYLAVGIPTEGVQIWRVADWQQVTTVSGWGTILALAPDGQTGAVPVDVNGGAILLWRTADGQIRQTLSGHPNQIHALAFSPNGALLASSDNKDLVRVWDVQTGTLLQTLELGVNNGAEAIAFSPDGHTLAMGSYGALRLWSLPGPVAQAAKHP